MEPISIFNVIKQEVASTGTALPIPGCYITSQVSSCHITAARQVSHHKQTRRTEYRGTVCLYVAACTASQATAPLTAYEDDKYIFYKKGKEKTNCNIKLCVTN